MPHPVVTDSSVVIFRQSNMEHLSTLNVNARHHEHKSSSIVTRGRKMLAVHGNVALQVINCLINKDLITYDICIYRCAGLRLVLVSG